MNTFKVGDTKIEEWFQKNHRPMKHWLKTDGVKEKVKGTTLHSSLTLTVGGTSPLFHALSYAFNNHCPLIITPDSAWLTILTGLTHHIDTDPEGLRHHFVQHEGKASIEVVLGASGLNTIDPDTWESIIHGGAGLMSPSFSEQLRDKLNPKRFDLLVCGFSTTTPIDIISSEVALMGAMKHWFEYKMTLACGLSTVTVAGSPHDWQDVISRVQVFEEFGLGWWTGHLLPVLEQIKLSCAGKPDIEFWKAAYLEHRKGSGGDYDVSGWINAFYPYIAGQRTKDMRRNPCIDWGAKGNRGVDGDDFPFGLVSAPVEVDDNGTQRKCEFYGGLVGVSMTNDFVVRPESGYAIQLL